MNDNHEGPKIVPLPTREAKINKAAIEYLEEMLEDARKGDLAEVAAVAVYKDNGFRTYQTGSSNTALMLGAVAYLQHTIGANIDRSSEDETEA